MNHSKALKICGVFLILLSINGVILIFQRIQVLPMPRIILSSCAHIAVLVLGLLLLIYKFKGQSGVEVLKELLGESKFFSLLVLPNTFLWSGWIYHLLTMGVASLGIYGWLGITLNPVAIILIVYFHNKYRV